MGLCDGAFGFFRTENLPKTAGRTACKVWNTDVILTIELAMHLFQRLHLHNFSLKDVKSTEESAGYVDRFGFACTTCLGFIAMPNTWKDSWIVSH